jgi:F-type H+-transporting ATPase subunit b
MDSMMVRELVTHALGFIAFFWVLKRFAFGPVQMILEERRKKIADGFSEVEQVRQEVDHLKVEYEKRLVGIEEEARQKLQTAFDEGRRMSAQVQEEARAQANGIIEKARQNVEFEIEKARLSLKNEVADLAIQMAERAVRAKFNEKEHDQLVNHLLDEVQKSS